MKKYLTNLILVLCCFILNNTYAASGDSVMSKPGVSNAPTLKYQGTSASSGNVYSYTAITQYQTTMCPSGLTANGTGSTIYNSAQRIITTTYLGSQVVGTNTGSWTDIDTDCVGTQTQVLACPAGYTGTIIQTRKVGTDVGGYVYSAWTTTVSNCVKIPVPKPGYTILIAKPMVILDENTYQYVNYVMGLYLNNQTGDAICGKTTNGSLVTGTNMSLDTVGCSTSGNISFNSVFECLSSRPCGQGDNDPVSLYYQAIPSSKSADNCQVTLRIYTNDKLLINDYVPYDIYGEYITFNLCQ